MMSSYVIQVFLLLVMSCFPWILKTVRGHVYFYFYTTLGVSMLCHIRSRVPCHRFTMPRGCILGFNYAIRFHVKHAASCHPVMPNVMRHTVLIIIYHIVLQYVMFCHYAVPCCIYHVTTCQRMSYRYVMSVYTLSMLCLFECGEIS